MYPIISENEKIVVIEDLLVMDDGVRLYTQIARPKDIQECPIVFERTPYADALYGEACDINELTKNVYLSNGYAYILQHCRGTGDSEGECLPYKNEREDGLKTLEYIRQLPFYNGEIFLDGASYTTAVHFSYLDTNPSDIKGAAFAVMADRMFFRDYRNGCCWDYGNLEWWLGMIKRKYPGAVEKIKSKEIFHRPYKDLMKRVIGEDIPEYTGILLNDTFNEWWYQRAQVNAINNLQIPVLLTEGWFDYYIDCMFSMWERLPEETRKKSAFVVGPWGHSTSVQRGNELSYPIENGDKPKDYTLEWFNSIRENRPYKYAQRNKVNYYLVGDASWHSGDYPTAGTAYNRFYFNTDNRLTNEPCGENEKQSYVYDPEQELRCFKYDYCLQAHEMNSINGVLSFQTAPFSADAAFYGKVHWNMEASSDCEDTAFFIRIYLVENGKAYNLTETITSLSHICKDYKVGERVTIDLYTPPIAFKVKEGCGVRVDIASDGGIYVPHANVKGQWAEVSESRIANNTIYLQNSFIDLFLQADGKSQA